MRIAIPRERRPDECRVAASPDTVKRFASLGVEVAVETGAGAAAGFADAAFAEAGAIIAADPPSVLAGADFVLKVQRPMRAGDDGPDELSLMRPGSVLVGILAALSHRADMAAYAEAGLTSFALDLLPRISRAQSMDVLSSQANLAGYRAVIDAAHAFGRALPMMMTAAGTIPPARVVVLGAGVAGLQAIATAKRLGAVVSAFDVRPAVRQEVESLGARYIGVPAADAQTAGGYAREMDPDYLKRQAEVIHETLKTHDIAICTALILGRPAPVLITEAMVKDMRPGSVIVDLAVELGGNCACSKFGAVVEAFGVTVIGHANMPSRLARDASAMYARNLFNFVGPMIDRTNKAFAIGWEDEIVKGCLVTRDGRVVHPMLGGGAA